MYIYVYIHSIDSLIKSETFVNCKQAHTPHNLPPIYLALMCACWGGGRVVKDRERGASTGKDKQTLLERDRIPASTPALLGPPHSCCTPFPRAVTVGAKVGPSQIEVVPGVWEKTSFR